MRLAHAPRRSEHVNIVFIGHVDAGKSTIGGQILFLTVRASERAPLAPRAAQPSRPPRGAGERGRALDPEVRARGEGEEPRELVHGTALRSSRLRGVAAAGTLAPGAWAQRLRANVAPGVVTPHASRCAARRAGAARGAAHSAISPSGASFTHVPLQAYIMDTNEEERAKGKTVEARPCRASRRGLRTFGCRD
jgi:hypothetical protein